MKRTGTVCLFVACLTLAITVRPAFAQTTTINDNNSHGLFTSNRPGLLWLNQCGEMVLLQRWQPGRQLG